MRAGLLILCAVCSVAAAERVDLPPVAVYVTATQGEDGYVDRASKRRDSILPKLKDKLAKSKLVRLVDRPEDAAITVELTDARFLSAQYHWQASTYLLATLIHGDYRLELTAADKTSASMMFKHKAHNALADQVLDWVRDNRAKLP
jgi:hypothetical protein